MSRDAIPCNDMSCHFTVLSAMLFAYMCFLQVVYVMSCYVMAMTFVLSVCSVCSAIVLCSTVEIMFEVSVCCVCYACKVCHISNACDLYVHVASI